MEKEKKYNLKQMLDEIREDETVTPRAVRTISQAEIKERVLLKRRSAGK